MATNSGNSGLPTSPENIYAFLIVLFGAVLGYVLYSNQLFSVAPPVPAAVRPSAAENITKLESVEFDFGIFENVTFQGLKVFGEIPVVLGTTGKADPFSP